MAILNNRQIVKLDIIQAIGPMRQNIPSNWTLSPQPPPHNGGKKKSRIKEIALNNNKFYKKTNYKKLLFKYQFIKGICSHLFPFCEHPLYLSHEIATICYFWINFNVPIGGYHDNILCKFGLFMAINQNIYNKQEYLYLNIQNSIYLRWNILKYKKHREYRLIK